LKFFEILNAENRNIWDWMLSWCVLPFVFAICIFLLRNLNLWLSIIVYWWH